MSKQLIELTVFISSPSAMAAEILLVEKAVENVSRTTQLAYGVLLKILKWEQDIVPGLGAGPQAVINSQIEDKYDIYIGLLGTYFGTPTPTFHSGTEEEFRSAYNRYTNAPETLRVLFYFKKTNDDVFSINIEQFNKVKDFRHELTSTALFGTFSTQDELLSLLSSHLHKLVSEQWAGNKWRVMSPIPVPEHALVENIQSPPPSNIADSSNDETDGFFELIALSTNIVYG